MQKNIRQVLAECRKMAFEEGRAIGYKEGVKDGYTSATHELMEAFGSIKSTSAAPMKRRRKREESEKAQLVKMAVAEKPGMTSNEIQQMVGVSKSLVSAMKTRDDLEIKDRRYYIKGPGNCLDQQQEG